MTRNIRDNMERIAKLTAIVESHLVGGKLDHSVPGKLRYIFFEEWCGLNGVQVSLAGGKANAYELLIKKLDFFYNEENKVWGWHKNIDSLA